MNRGNGSTTGSHGRTKRRARRALIAAPEWLSIRRERAVCAQSHLPGAYHGRQDGFSGIIHRSGHPVQERLGRRRRRFAAWWTGRSAEGTNGLVPVGTTGESPTLSHDEHKKVVEWCIDQAKRRVPVIAGAGSNSTREAIDLARACREGRRRRGAGGHALLQQADPGRPLPALQGDQRRDRHSDHHLQHPGPLGDRHVGRHHEAALRAREHRRRQGRHRQHGAGVPAAGASSGRSSTSSPARTRPRSASWPMAAMAASP